MEEEVHGRIAEEETDGATANQSAARYLVDVIASYAAFNRKCCFRATSYSKNTSVQQVTACVKA